MTVNAYKTFQDVYDRALTRFFTMDNDEFVASIEMLMIEDGGFTGGPVTVSAALDTMTRRGSIDAAAALAVVVSNCCEEHKPKFEKMRVDAMSALFMRSADLQSGAAAVAIEEMQRKAGK